MSEARNRTTAAIVDRPAPELDTVAWFGVDRPPTLRELRGRVVVLEAFQMLCPGCVAYGIPQAQRVHDLFGEDVAVLGLHTVFEHHAAMTPVALEAFLTEYRVTFPVGIDRHEAGDPRPVTMRRYGMVGTPTTVVVDRAGIVRHHVFGREDDLRLGAVIGRLLGASSPDGGSDPPGVPREGCSDVGCSHEGGGTTP